jgi:hypothetical protein
MKLMKACAVVAIVLTGSVLTSGQSGNAALELLRSHQMDLSTDGREFLSREAEKASFFLVGGLHGDNETPALVQKLWPDLKKFGYRYVALEMSPWAAGRADAVSTSNGGPALRGSDMEEPQPNLLIRDLAAANSGSVPLRSMADLTKSGYRRSQAPELLRLARQVGDVRDVTVGGASLKRLVLRTLEIEVERSDPKASLAASTDREGYMKELFAAHYRSATVGDVRPKVVAVFGQNHLHRGYDQRGVSTLGNFIAELAAADGVASFHLALFAAGGKVFLGGLQDADQRKDEAAFEALASVARFPATVFDLRPLRPALHSAPQDKLSPLEANLLYWADSYDAIVCYREVTPASAPPPGR